MPSNENNKLLKRPTNRDLKIWRYMDTEKYIYLLYYHSLFFIRSDRLSDTFEGSWAKADVERRNKENDKIFKRGLNIPDEILTKQKIDESKILMNLRKNTFLNCWHMNENESMAMWQVYGGLGKAISIQSTYQRLHDSVTEDVTLGLVEYIDFDTESFFAEERKAVSPFYFKRKPFDYENELRASIQRHKWGVADPNEVFDESEIGIDLVIDLNKLIVRVVVSPNMPLWLFKMITSISPKFDCTFPIEKSKLDAAPIY